MHGYGRIPSFSPAGLTGKAIAQAGTSIHVTGAKPCADGCTSQPILGVWVRCWQEPSREQGAGQPLKTQVGLGTSCPSKKPSRKRTAVLVGREGLKPR